MATHTTRQTASTLFTTSRCLWRQSSAAARLLAVPAAQRCMHQEHQPPAEVASSAGISYRPMINRNRAPFSLRGSKPFTVNEDPEKLDAMYRSLLGGNSGLSEEIKLQAVTHKSFDHGWQPYNEKLAFFGKLVLQLHTSLHHLATRPKSLGPRKPHTASTENGANGPVLKPFHHPDYHYLTFVNRKSVQETLSAGKLGHLARVAGLPEVMRWKPVDVNDLVKSGQTDIAVECLYAIIGAVALRRGGDVAGRLVRERILSVLGAAE
ncbi:ribonuclease-III-like-domain-containing protein [Morchella snyderi]|nr:ribonuclease-III-like-domain-containing protein [Morchella snyderi]